jgi:hypothetical protein
MLFAPHALHVIILVSHICTYAIDPMERKMEVAAVQIQWRLGGPQASSGEDANIVLDQGKPWCIPPWSLSSIFELYL